MTVPPAVLAVTNAEHEPLGMIAPWLLEAGVDVEVVQPWAETRSSGSHPIAGSAGSTGSSGSRAVVDALGRHHGLIVMGGPQAAYDDPATGEPDAPWLPDLKRALRLAVDAGMPVLAVCLGAQLLAEACGGLVRPGDRGAELGARLVAKRDAAAADPLFGRLPMSPDVVQWHWDEIAVLPAGALLLASAPAYANQAFRVGPAAYGLQFHIEATPDIVRVWAEHDAPHLGEPGTPGAVDVERMLAGVVRVQQQVAETWRPFVEGWAGLVRDRADAPRPRGGAGGSGRSGGATEGEGGTESSGGSDRP